MINTDKASAYGDAIRQLKEEGKCPEDLEHRQVKYLNNRVEAETAHQSCSRVSIDENGLCYD
jgi:transposase-like protein